MTQPRALNHLVRHFVYLNLTAEHANPDEAVAVASATARQLARFLIGNAPEDMQLEVAGVLIDLLTELTTLPDMPDPEWQPVVSSIVKKHAGTIEALLAAVTIAVSLSDNNTHPVPGPTLFDCPRSFRKVIHQ